MRKLLLFLFLSTAYAEAPLLWGPNDTSKNLQSNLNLKDTLQFLQGTDDPTAVAKTATRGSVYCRTGASGGTCYVKQDNGSSTNWTSIILSPGGSDSHIQYNNSGAFGGESALAYNDVDDRVGIQQSSPLAALHVNSAIADSPSEIVSALTGTLNVESFPSNPTDALSQVEGPSDSVGGTSNATANYAGTGYTANGAQYDYTAYYYVTIDGVRYYRGTAQTFNTTDDSSTNPLSITINITRPGNTTGTVLVGSNGSLMGTKDLGGSATYEDDATVNADSLPTDSSGVLFPYVTGPDDSSGASLSNAQISGTSSYPSADGTYNVPFNIYAYKTLDGNKYYSGTASTTNFTDDSSTNPFDIQLNWSAVSGADGYIIQASGGSGTNYQGDFTIDVGNVNTYDITSSTGGAASIPAAFATYGPTHSYRIHGAHTPSITPTGTVYNPTYTSYSSQLTNYANGYAVLHTWTIGTNTGYWLLGSSTRDTSYSGQINNLSTSNLYETISSWAGASSVTPVHYGYLSTGQTRYARMYVTRLAGTTYYSPSGVATSVVFPNDSVYRYITYSWTAQTAPETGYKLVRGTTGTTGPWVDSVTSLAISDSSYTDTTLGGWGQNASTFTPSSITTLAGRFDNASGNSLLGESTVAIIDTTGSGTRYPRLSFGIAASSSDSPTYQNHIFSESSTSDLHLVGRRVHLRQSPTGTDTTSIGEGTNHFNIGKSGTDATKIWSSVAAKPAINVDNASGTVSINDDSTSGVGLIVKGKSNSVTPFTIRNYSASPGDYPMKVESNVGSALMRVGLAGEVQGTGTVSSPALSFVGDSDSGFYPITTNTIGIAAGGAELARFSTVGFSFKTGLAPTAKIHIAAGSTSASTAPIKLTSGSLMSSAEVGAEEFLTDKRYFTITTGTARKEYTFNDIALTSTRVPFATTNGRLTDDSDMTFATDRLTATKMTTTLDTHTSSAAPGSPAEGDVWNDSTQKALMGFVDGVKQHFIGNLFSQTATATVANTVTETAISSTGVGTLTLPANFLVAGKTLRIKGLGYHSSTGNPTITIRVKLGSTTVCTATGTSGNGSNDGFEIDTVTTLRTTGSSGTQFTQGRFREDHSSGLIAGCENTATGTINTTTSQAVSVTAEWGTADVGNTISMTNLTVEALN